MGLFHGLMSFVGLLDVGETATSLREMAAHDAPRFEYRGHQVDVARNFRSKEALRKTIDAMALYKVRPRGGGAPGPGTPSGLTTLTLFNVSPGPRQLNVLHLALTNDESWRLAIPGLDELTSVGSRRCFDPTEETCLLPQVRRVAGLVSAARRGHGRPCTGGASAASRTSPRTASTSS